MAFERVASMDDVPDETAFAIEVGGRDIFVARSEGEFFAAADVCSHAAVALSEGEVEDCAIECWLHGSRFDLRTGKPIGLPATEPVATYAVEVRGADLYVDTTETLNGVSQP
jgi:3-phenylpropionate/trans-cinnamate dioxygenase ferredoxin component